MFLLAVSVGDSGVKSARCHDQHRGGVRILLGTPTVLDVGDVQIVGQARLAVPDGQPLTGVRALRHLAERYVRGGLPAVETAMGQFSVVMWDAPNHRLVAVKDAIGLLPLYHRMSNGVVYISDRADVFPSTASFDTGFIAAFIASGGICVDRTIWSDVSRVQGGTSTSWAEGLMHVRRYWTAEGISQDLDVDKPRAARMFASALRSAVQDAMEPDNATWADLSGGLDSSSVVCMAASLKSESGRLGGTISYIDTLGGDETAFVESVANQCQLHSVRFLDCAPWDDDGAPPPVTAEPARDYPFYARDRKSAAILSRSGGKVLLSGVGPDCYMQFSPHHIGDLLASRQLRDAAKQTFRWSYVRRQPIWKVLARDVLLPFAPVAVQRRVAARTRPAPRWIRRGFLRNSDFLEHWRRPFVVDGTPGRFGQVSIARYLRRLSASLHNWREMDGIEIRQPFLDRRLVELCLRLPTAVRTDTASSKPVLRGAMGALLPRTVLRRQCTKGSGLQPRICSAFRNRRQSLQRLLKQSVLADLGCVEPDLMRREVDEYCAGRGDVVTTLYTALALETWLAVRSNRYAPHVDA